MIMFLNIQDLTEKELQRLEMKFGDRLSAYHNPYYQIWIIKEPVNKISILSIHVSINRIG